MIISSSVDVLNIAIAFAVVLVALFIAWFLYYMIAILRDARAMVSEVRQKMESRDNAIQSIRGKVESSMSGFTVVAAALKQVLSFVMGKRRAAEDQDTEDEQARSRRKK